MINRREFGAVLMGMAAPGIPRNYLPRGIWMS